MSFLTSTRNQVVEQEVMRGSTDTFVYKLIYGDTIIEKLDGMKSSIDSITIKIKHYEQKAKASRTATATDR